jgi:diacylglycerol kinase family enzyme
MPRADDFVYLVNPRSGGQAGRRLLAELRSRLPTERVLATGEFAPEDLVRRWRDRAAGFIACGGDGTAASVLDAVARVGSPTLPVGIIPLGTGNDLARVAGAPLGGPLDARLAWIAAARPRPLDRWLLSDPLGSVRAWFNYCSWGCDARIAGRFQRLRDLHGPFLRARAANLLCYAGLGLQEPGSDLGVEAAFGEGAGAVVPAWARSLVVANIASYAGGRVLGPRIASDDGRCDVFSLAAGVALGIGLSGLRRPRSHGAHATVTLRLRRPLHLQLDGETRLAGPGRYRIALGGQVALLGA